MSNPSLRRYHAAVWDEPIVLEMGRDGRRGMLIPEPEAGVRAAGTVDALVPASARRQQAPALPQLTEFEVQRHYLHLSQETLGMMGVSLFGTCTMKYNPRLNELLTARPWLAELHPGQDEDTLQGVLQIVDSFSEMLCELSGMSQFVFQPGGGADAAYTQACITRAYHEHRGELAQRDEVITTIQAHPCNAATAAAAGFKVITASTRGRRLSVGGPRWRLSSASAPRRSWSTATPTYGDLQPAHQALGRDRPRRGGLAFYDHANFNGVIGRLRARELGFDACMFMLHRPWGAKGGGGPARGRLRVLGRAGPVPAAASGSP